MNEKINEKVEVTLISKTPTLVYWRGRNYKIEKIGLHHTFREGRVLYHIFSVTTATLFMKLGFNAETLAWRLEETFDRFL